MFKHFHWVETWQIRVHFFKTHSSFIQLHPHRRHCWQVDPGDAGHVGDHVVEDYWAARNVGMHAFLLDGKGDASSRAEAANVAVRPNCVMRELRDLVAIIDSDFTAVAETTVWWTGLSLGQWIAHGCTSRSMPVVQLTIIVKLRLYCRLEVGNI